MSGQQEIRLPQSLSSALALCTLALCALAACGGGGDSSTSHSAATSANEAATTARPASTTAAAKDSSFSPQDEFAATVLAAINDARAEARRCGDKDYPAVAAIRWNPRVTDAARLESQWMQTDNAWGHTWPDGTTVTQRLDRAGYFWHAAGENIAAGFITLEAVMQAWLDSPGHCVNIMRADVDDVGVALVWGGRSNTYRSYWTMVLAQPAASELSAAHPQHAAMLRVSSDTLGP